MIKLGKLTDYAVTLLTQLSTEEGAALSAHALAQKTGLPEPTVAKIMKKLSQEKLVESTRGAAGGYGLARPATDISVCAVIEAMDGPIAITACVDEMETPCAVKCQARGKWNPVNTAIRDALLSVTIADMAKPSGAQIVQITGGRHAGIG